MRYLTYLMVLSFGLLGCIDSTNSPVDAQTAFTAMYTFDTDDTLDQQIVGDGVSLKLHHQKLHATFLATTHLKPSLVIAPSQAWNWNDLGPIMINVDIANASSQSTHLFVEVADDINVHNRSVVIPAGSSKTYYILLNGTDITQPSGIRSNPAPWSSGDVPFIWRWGTKQLNLAKIKHLKFTMQSLGADRELAFDNIALVKQPATDPDYLTHLVDKYGQRLGKSFTGKIFDDQQLLENSRLELNQLTDRLPVDRSKFGGWLNGKKQHATGYFRTAKIDDEWSLVDPLGYPFFSMGIANVRMANTSTMTGYDFDPGLIKNRSDDDLTPEDSLGLNQVPTRAIPSRTITSSVRANMFSWLPGYGEPLGKHFGYRREVHSGALSQGETFSFYQANLERKYGDDYIDQWRDVTVKRMRNWGFTSFGNWVDPMFYQLDQFPYFANGWIIGDFKTVSSGDDYWSALPDPFDPVFADRARATVEQIAKEVQGNPYCVGVFIDNEKSWGAMGSDARRFGIAVGTLKRGASESPTKKAFSQYLKNLYSTVGALNDAWQTQYTDWESFNESAHLPEEYSAKLHADLRALMSLYADKYFAVVSSALKQAMPNHLYMGARFADWGMTTEVVNAAAKHADVMSYNFYKEVLHPEAFAFLDAVDKPSIIGEFHMGATDSGLLNPGLVHAQSQSDRANMYINYMNSVIQNPYFVGAHWFQYTDSPLTGRAYDGENYNVGFVSVTDTPYKEMVAAVKQVSSQLYENKFNETRR